MGWHIAPMGKKEKGKQNSWQEYLKETSWKRPRVTGEANIKMDLEETG
jgi:hypothetical protein